MLGALSNLWLGDRFGRRRTIMLGGIVMIIGAILQAASFSYTQMIVARVVTGLGNGLNTSTVPPYHAECSPASKRGSLIMIEGSLITFGIMISYDHLHWIDFALFWANSHCTSILLAVVMVGGVYFLPESPRWLLKVGRAEEALAVVSALEGKDCRDPEVQRTFHAIQEAVALESLPTGQHFKTNISDPALSHSSSLRRFGSRASLRELFTGGPTQNFRRVTLGVVIQCFQQITGINIITYYATLLFERLGISDTKSRIIAACNGTEYFLASIAAIFLIDRVGRRRLMFFGSVGQTLTMVLLAVLGSISTSATQVISAILLFVFNSFFAIGWLGMTWLYPAEIVGLRMRGPANALSTASNWIFNFLVVMVTGPSFESISWRTYIETKGRSLEDMDVIFALAYREKVSPVAVSLRDNVPLAGSAEADEILNVKINSM
ncbi:general substrate transporter [Cyathus striatus]|nr:general substrate transporter [Cyathus striatus]